MTRDEHTYGFEKQDAIEIIQMIGSKDGEQGLDDPDGRHAIIVQTPEGGIPARSGATVGKADCTIFRVTSADELESTGVTVSVVNLALEAVGASVYAQAKKASGRWVIDQDKLEGEAGDSLFAFELTGDMADNEATADIYELNGTELGAFVESSDVFDPVDIFFLLTNGAEGLCMLRNGVYYIIQAKCPVEEP